MRDAFVFLCADFLICMSKADIALSTAKKSPGWLVAMPPGLVSLTLEVMEVIDHDRH
jgi:hypothetical protein